MSAAKQLEDAIFFTALHIADPEQRRVFLDQACMGNSALRSVVEEMISTQTDAEDLLERGLSAFSLFADELPVPVFENDAAEDGPGAVDERIGTRIGCYKILQRIGEGGCGVVYMAEQEKPIRRRVALKVIKLGMDTKNVIARFEAERQALALMDHPNIARVLDAGATETGRSYFVMELVRGVRITEHCDQNQFDTRQRLELFIQVCHAIQHAHQKGVIHRDIKPSNVLVTLHDGVPVPKVIDFGIAKAIEGKLAEQTLFTAYEQLIGTPAYMSPEQAEMSGLDVDTRSDIYSLGVLLYELLAGKTPFDQKEMMQSGVEGVRRTLREREPQRPSGILTTLHGVELTATAAYRHSDPPKLIALLKGDLDWIVMKALEKDRTRRYETANGLAMDVWRHLNNEPVVARPPSRLYRFLKLARRNKIVFMSGGLVLLSLLAGLGVSTWLFFREREARHEQVVLREKAENAEQRAEAREKINQSAIYVHQGKYDDASKLLGEVKSPLPKPSFDGVLAYRTVGEWLALHGRWDESAARYLGLMEIDKLDPWGEVTLDYQACGVVLMESRQLWEYDAFCRITVDGFATTTNGDAAGRILKTCLLLPSDTNLLRHMQPLGDAAEQYFQSLGRQSLWTWSAVPVGLWQYRAGNYDKAVESCRRCLSENDKTTAQNATLRIILAMSVYQNGDVALARAQLTLAKEAIDARCKKGIESGNDSNGHWYDWIFARQLLREAMALIETEPPSSASPAK